MLKHDIEVTVVTRKRLTLEERYALNRYIVEALDSIEVIDHVGAIISSQEGNDELLVQ